MRKIYTVLLVMGMLLPAFSKAGWVDKQGNQVPDSDHMRSVGDLVAQLVITDNESQVLKNWGTPSESVYFPTADKIERNKVITAFVVFGGCAVDAKGNCDLRMQITVYKPDGSIYSKLPVMEVWSDKPVPPNRSLGLSAEYMRVIIEPEDPLGKYQVDTKIMDKVSGDNMLLKSSFTAVESQNTESIEEFGYKMSYFYLAPGQEEFSAFQKSADHFKPRLDETGNGADILVAVMIARISETYGWPIADGAFAARSKEILEGKTDFAKYISDDSQVDPTKLDIWWASFSATGEERYLENIFQYAGQELPKGDTGRMLVIGAAKWSFKANCRQHDKVLHFAKIKLESATATESQKSFLKECIDYAESESMDEQVSAAESLILRGSDG
ncbi:MAG: hypothetical protein ABFS24_14775 [Pseudomonadota bacterium]